MAEPGARNLATVFISHRVDADREADFRAWQKRVTEVESTFPGFRGSELFSPVPGVQDTWTIMYEFDSAEHVNGWLDSPQRAALLEETKEFQDFEVHRLPRPFGTWVPASNRDGTDGVGAASWKTALAVLVGLYPTVVILTIAIAEAWPGVPLWLSLLVGNVLSVSLLTWVVMPVVTRALEFWLVPAEHSRPGSDVLGAAISLGFLAAAATVFWLVTRVLWHLP